MDFLLLTKSTTFIIGPVASVLGEIMNFLFNIGIHNIGLCIILFTFIIKLLMFPLTIKQQKSQKIMSVMNPEIQAIQNKYKGKTDQTSMQKQQAEIQAVYAKYGTSPTGGCLQLIIQMPILFALYQVISKIPAYVDGVRVYFEAVVAGISAQPGFIDTIAELASGKAMPIDKFDLTVSNTFIDLLYKFTNADWETLTGLFTGNNALQTLIVENSAKIMDLNMFLGLNLTEAPGFRLSAALVIPVLAGLTQWISTKLMSTNQSSTASEDPTAQSMKMMNTTMPLISAFFCVSMPIGIGIYWIASSAFQILQQLLVNAYMSKMDVDDLVKANLEKQNKKRAKKGLPPQTISKTAQMDAKRSLDKEEREAARRAERQAKTEEIQKESTEYYNSNTSDPNSLASRAQMVKKFNEKNNK